MLRPDILRTNVELLAAATYLQISIYIVKAYYKRHQLCSDIDIEAVDFHPIIFIFDY